LANNGSIKLYVFVLVIGLSFPTLGYTFTTLGGSPTQFDISIDDEILLLAGISLQQAESHNISFNGGYVTFDDLNDTEMRLNWRTWQPGPLGIGASIDGIKFERKLWGFYWGDLGVQSLGSSNWQFFLVNATIVNDWDDNYNWSRFELRGLAWQVFVTPYPGYNITGSVYDIGNLTITLGRVIDTDASPNWRTFIDWYFGVLVGTDEWGLPSVFNWLLRIMSGISLLSAVLLAKEIISL